MATMLNCRWPSSSAQRVHLFSIAVIVAAIGAAYCNSFHVPLLLDDLVTIAANPSIERLWPLGDVFAPPPHIYSSGRPLLNLSFALNYSLGGTQVQGYHAVNILIHIAAAITLYGLVHQILSRNTRSAESPGVCGALSALAALIWALHPVQTAAVTYISQRAESLMGLFYLVTLWCFAAGATTGRMRWFALATIACGFGMATKEVMVTAPVVAVMYDRVFLSSSFAEVFRRRGRVHACLASTWLILAFLMLTSDIGQRDIGATSDVTWLS